MPCGGPKSLPYIDIVLLFFIFSGPLVLKGSTILFAKRAALNPGLGDVRDVASAII